MLDESLGPFAVVLALMLATVLLVGVGERIRRPYPVLVLLLGIVMALVPAIPMVRVDPDMILPLFLPPLIYAAAQRSSWAVLWSRRSTVFALAGVLVLVTVAAVTLTALQVVPGITLAAAIALGAMVAPPDPVAAEAVARPLRLPRRLVTTLQTEGLCNDATALVVYGIAVSAIVGDGELSVGGALLDFVIEATVAVLAGLGVGALARLLQRVIVSSSARNGLTLVIPFATYILADELHGSGVIAVLTVGLFMAQTGEDEVGVRDRVSGGAFWETLELLMTGLAFGLIGLELQEVLASGEKVSAAVLPAVAICGVVLGVRFAWMLVAGPLVRRLSRTDGEPDPDRVPMSWREDLVLAWCGMRGLASIALALALPLVTPARGVLLLVTFAVILVTLVLPGLTLSPMVRVLRVHGDTDREEEAARALFKRAAKAALNRLREMDARDDLPSEVVDNLRERYRTMIGQLRESELDEDVKQQLAERTEQMRWAREVRNEMLAAARREVLTARAEPGIDPATADRVLRRLDLGGLV